MKRLERLLNIKNHQIIESEQVLNQIKLRAKFDNTLLSGSKIIEYLLQGGFRAGEMYLVYGENKTGKTQLCHQLCIQTVGIGRGIYYLDTENTFRADRVIQMATNRINAPYNILKEIYVSKISSNSMLKLVLNEIEIKLNSLNDSGRTLLVVDSINNYFRYERGIPDVSYHKTATIFLQILEKLSDLTERYNLITIATAQVTPNLIKNTEFSEIPVGNQYLNHFFTEHVYLKRNYDGSNIIYLLNSQNLPEKQATYIITTSGIE
ncbi:MAG: hypothetical protein ACFFAS_14210 [Promethearchaeota archaeon]